RRARRGGPPPGARRRRRCRRARLPPAGVGRPLRPLPGPRPVRWGRRPRPLRRPRRADHRRRHERSDPPGPGPRPGSPDRPRSHPRPGGALMFTGIVEELGTVVSREGPRLRIAASTVLEDIAMGASIAVNGVCLTVVGWDEGEGWWEADV